MNRRDQTLRKARKSKSNDDWKLHDLEEQV